MRIRESLASSVVLGALSLGMAGCENGPRITKYEDVTGDGIKDIQIYDDAYTAETRGNYLFIGKEDGTFIRTQEKKTKDIRYLISDEGEAYFFDGEYYRLSPKQD